LINATALSTVLYLSTGRLLQDPHKTSMQNPTVHIPNIFKLDGFCDYGIFEQIKECFFAGKNEIREQLIGKTKTTAKIH